MKTVTIEEAVEGGPHSRLPSTGTGTGTAASDPLDLSSSSYASSIWDKPLPPTPPYEGSFPLSPMLQRYPSFVPLRRHATSIASVAFLVPSSDSALRKATVTAATFNMTATIIGGGVLSIPLSCARAGVIPFTALMVMSAVMTDFSLYILCSCARRTGSTSYGGVARISVGPNLELFTTAVIFFLVGLIVVGLMVLNQGIWSPIFMTAISIARGQTPQPTTMFQDAIVLLFLLALMLPFLLKRNLTALRHICYVGFFSIAILCVAMAYRAAEKNLVTHPGLFHDEVSWATDSFANVLNALPIILLAFLCSFNIISVHCSLIDPTRERVRELIRRAVVLSFLIMYVFGLAGYLYAYEDTDGNILLNFDPSDGVIFLGRVGCGITTLFALPMNLLPCREALISLMSQIGERGADSGTTKKRALTKAEQKHLLAHRSEDETRSETPSFTSGGQNAYDSFRGTTNTGSTKSPAAQTVKESPEQAQSFSCGERAFHWGATLAIVTVCYVAAVLAPGVAIVWDIAGSCFAFLIQFIIPAVCYIRLKNKVRRRVSRRVAYAWALLVFASVGALLCTAQTIWRLAFKH